MCLENRTSLILGYGETGRRVARCLAALGMKVLAVRRRLGEMVRDGSVEIHPADRLESLLPLADALVITLPLTQDTRGLIGRTELERLPENAVLVNVGRGPIVDEQALYDSLKSGVLGAAGLDVWYAYPEDETSRSSTAPSKLPYHELQNVVMSPHRAGTTEASERLRMSHLASLLNAAARGEPIPNRVDLDAGY